MGLETGFVCKVCLKKSKAVKSMKIFKPPKILILHLKQSDAISTQENT